MKRIQFETGAARADAMAEAADTMSDVVPLTGVGIPTV
jgi:hypothetical protein